VRKAALFAARQSGHHHHRLKANRRFSVFPEMGFHGLHAPPVNEPDRIMRAILRSLTTVGAVLSTTLAAFAAPTATLTVQANKPGAKISPTMWGIFFEDANFAADGGLYAELVKNRSFEFPDPMMGWGKIAPGTPADSIEIRDQDPFNAANPHYLRIKAHDAAGGFGVANEGFRGMGVREGESYSFSAQLRAVEGQPALRIALVAGDGRKLAEARLTGFDRQWKKCSATLRAAATEPKARLNIYVEGPGMLDFDMVSLFPEKTWKNRPGGLRADLVQMLADLKPGFVKFPGGFPTEGRRLENRYQWKPTIGDIAERKPAISSWNESRLRPTPDYFQSFGLGFFEYFQLCEDLGAEPLPVLNCGMASQLSGEMAPLDQLDPYIQDALDLIEFANGPTNSYWGKKRAEMGHPQPFNLKMLRLGNEHLGPPYLERYERFARVLKAKHPEIKLVAGPGPEPDGDDFKVAWEKLRGLPVDIVDEHAHRPPDWFFSSAFRYDKYDRHGPKVMMAEYAAHSMAGNRNNWECALSEAAFHTGLERNADIVAGSCYAVLFAHADAWQWMPDLIWFDNLRAYGTPSYYVQQMFSRNRGDAVLPLDVQAPEVSSEPGNGGAIGVGTWGTQAEFKDMQVTRDGRKLFSCDFANGTNGWKLLGAGNWKVEAGVLRQNSAAFNVRAIAGDRSWTNYTFSLKARKLGGAEGFLILFNVQNENAPSWWNLGGWGNTRHGIEASGIAAQVPGSIETGRWYDIKIVLKGARIECYLDGKLVQSADYPVRRTPALFASATQDKQFGEVILKVVNPWNEPVETRVNLSGVRVTVPAQAIVLTSPQPADENSFAAPKNIFPVEEPVPNANGSFNYSFRPYSVTVLRVKVD
jgi:alpha-L-arabinofuranosidase